MGCQVEDGTSPRTVGSPPGSLGLHPTPAVPRSHDSAFVGGTPLDEARSLLRPCLPHGHYGAPPARLPPLLERMLAGEMALPLPLFERYLQRVGIRESDLGGPLATPLPKARYLVIHDTSSKNMHRLPAQGFPADINTEGWEKNQWQHLIDYPVAHVFVARVGTSRTAHEFSSPYSSTKYTIGQPADVKLKFCHVELVQPRLGPGKSDWMAPQEGFPAPQLERLAVIYIAASLRHGSWLVPAYHHNVDKGLPSAHDDPQNFDLAAWVAAIAQVEAEVRDTHPRGDHEPGRQNTRGV